jgi:hypothetical protein
MSQLSDIVQADASQLATTRSKRWATSPAGDRDALRDAAVVLPG